MMVEWPRIPTLDNRSNRLKLETEIRHQTPLAGALYLAYRRPKSG